MHFAILAYHAEGVVESWTPEEDAASMTDLLAVNDRLVREGHPGPAARELRGANPTAVYEIRPVPLFIAGAPLKQSGSK